MAKGVAKSDHNKRGASDTSAKTDVFLLEFLRDSVGMKKRFAEIAADPQYRKVDGSPLSEKSVQGWYNNWKRGLQSKNYAKRTTTNATPDNWAPAWYPAALSGREHELIAALDAIAENNNEENTFYVDSEQSQHFPDAIDLQSPPERVRTSIRRIVRDSQLVQRVKAIHRYRCQIKNCQHEMRRPDDSTYVEAHHLQPLGCDHNGCDKSDNILCVCPHHHAALDMAIMTLARTAIDERPEHKISDESLEYHNNLVRGRWRDFLHV